MNTNALMRGKASLPGGQSLRIKVPGRYRVETYHAVNSLKRIPLD